LNLSQTTATRTSLYQSVSEDLRVIQSERTIEVIEKVRESTWWMK